MYVTKFSKIKNFVFDRQFKQKIRESKNFLNPIALELLKYMYMLRSLGWFRAKEVGEKASLASYEIRVFRKCSEALTFRTLFSRGDLSPSQLVEITSSANVYCSIQQVRALRRFPSCIFLFCFFFFFYFLRRPCHEFLSSLSVLHVEPR